MIQPGSVKRINTKNVALMQVVSKGEMDGGSEERS